MVLAAQASSRVLPPGLPVCPRMPHHGRPFWQSASDGLAFSPRFPSSLSSSKPAPVVVLSCPRRAPAGSASTMKWTFQLNFHPSWFLLQGLSHEEIPELHALFHSLDEDHSGAAGGAREEEADCVSPPITSCVSITHCQRVLPVTSMFPQPHCVHVAS